MTALETMYVRRAVRDYLDKPVPEQVVRELINAAIQAPSAINVQPWSFVVIQDKDLLAEISAKALELMRNRPLPPEVRTLIDRPNWNIFYNAGTLIVVCARPEGERPDWDCCLATENLLLAAREIGLGSCVIGFAIEALSDPKMKSKLNVPVDHQVVMPVILGYPRDFPPPTGRKTPEILSWKVAATV